jgi:hypothetical protein
MAGSRLSGSSLATPGSCCVDFTVIGPQLAAGLCISLTKIRGAAPSSPIGTRQILIASAWSLGRGLAVVES